MAKFYITSHHLSKFALNKYQTNLWEKGKNETIYIWASEIAQMVEKVLCKYMLTLQSSIL